MVPWYHPNTTWWGLLLCFYLVVMVIEAGVHTCICNFGLKSKIVVLSVVAFSVERCYGVLPAC